MVAWGDHEENTGRSGTEKRHSSVWLHQLAFNIMLVPNVVGWNIP